MPLDFSIAQLIIVSDRTGANIVAKSDGLSFALEEAALRIAVKFGRRPAGVAVPGALFATPFNRTHVFVVRVTDGLQGELVFHALMLNRPLYEALGDPFAIADRFPVDWSARGALPGLQWPGEPLPPRKVEVLAELMKIGEGPLLLGATQLLLDGGRFILKKDVPQETPLRTLWQLLPTRSRGELWPATFAFSNDLGFHALVMPELPEKLPLGYLREEQVQDYPEGRYELSLQIAIEAGNQHELDRLFARASSRDMFRLAGMILLVALLVAIIGKLMR